MRNPYLADLVIKDKKDDPLAVIDVVNFPGFSREQAIGLRRRLIDYGLPAQLPYFLLLTQDIGFLWKDTEKDQLDVPPNYEFPMDGLVQRYEKASSQRRLYRWELEWLILQWFAHLRASSEPDTEEPELTLVRSGLRELIKDVSLLPDEEV
jgi:hypothetical protein